MKTVNLEKSIVATSTELFLTLGFKSVTMDDIAEEMKILARRVLGKKKAIEISVPYRPRVGDAEIHTWGDGWKNLKFIWAKRFGLNRTKTEWGPLEDNPDSLNGDIPEQK